jgi:hypothetical protein
MHGMRRLSVSAIALGLVLGTACSSTPGVEPASGSNEPGPNERLSDSPAPGTSSDAGADDSNSGPPSFEGGVFRIGARLREVLIGRNWTPGCPVAIRDLRLVQVSYWNFHGRVRTGPLVLNERVARDVLWVFRRLFRAHFPIKKIKLAAKDRPLTPKDYWDPSPRSVTASFNCRFATGSTTSLSQHSYGWAVDINPLQNPYVRNDGTTLRYIALPFRDRSLQRKGMIHAGDIVVRSFAAIGWEWGGHWHTLKDYMHFSLTGR